MSDRWWRSDLCQPAYIGDTKVVRDLQNVWFHVIVPQGQKLFQTCVYMQLYAEFVYMSVTLFSDPVN